MSIPPDLLNTITTGDARVLSERIPDESVDLVFCDPPYWVGYDYGAGRTDRLMDYIPPSELVGLLQRVGRVVVITPGIGNLHDYPKPRWTMGWFKFGSTGRSYLGGFNVWEPLLVYGEPLVRVWQDAINLPFAPNLTRGDAGHACPKPHKLMRWLVECFTIPGGVVLDPMCGSGMMPAVCKMLGRQYVAFEIDPTTAERARERVLMTQAMHPAMLEEQQPMDLQEGEVKKSA